MKKIKKMTDQQCMELVLELIATRVKIGLAFASDPETGILTHQILVLTCGETRMQSPPEKMLVPLMPVVPKNETIN
jgi:hypothetical protein